MRMLGLAVGAALGVVAVGCTPGGPIHVRSYWATTTDRMPCGSTYDWLSSANETTPSLADPDLHALIQTNIEDDLVELGYHKRRGEGEPDFFISYRSGTGIQPTATGPATMALLAIEAHRRDGRLLWRGWAEGEVNPDAPPEVRRARIEGAIRKILREFHPA